MCSVLAAGIDKYIFILLPSVVLPFCVVFLLFLSFLVMSLNAYMVVIASSYK